MQLKKTYRLLIRLRPVLRFVKTRILHVQDSPERLARGIAIGVFMAWLPLFGLQIILSLFLAAILRANKVMAVLFTWISNPLTAVFIYYPAYRLGRFLLGVGRKKPEMDPEQIEDIFTETLSLEHVVTDFFTVDLWKQIHAFFLQIGLEMTIGGVLIGLVAATVSYFAFRSLILRFRNRRRWRLRGSQPVSD